MSCSVAVYANDPVRVIFILYQSFATTATPVVYTCDPSTTKFHTFVVAILVENRHIIEFAGVVIERSLDKPTHMLVFVAVPKEYGRNIIVNPTPFARIFRNKRGLPLVQPTLVFDAAFHILVIPL